MGNQCVEQAKIVKTDDFLKFKQSAQPQQVFLNPRRRLFKDIFTAKKQQFSTEFVMIVGRHGKPTHKQTISLRLDIFQDILQFQQQRSFKFQIQKWPILDPHQLGSSFLNVRNVLDKRRYTLRGIGFDRFQDQVFKEALYQIHICNLLDSKAVNNVAQLKDAFILYSPQVQRKRLTLIQLFDPTDLTLHELIMERRQSGKQWLQREFQILVEGCIKALNDIHKVGIVHRDIRPHNIAYSVQKKAFSIVGLGAAKVFDSKLSDTHSIRGVPLYYPPQLSQFALQGSQIAQYDPFSADIFSLSLTLLQALGLNHGRPSIETYKQMRPPQILMMLGQLHRKYKQTDQIAKYVRNMGQPKQSSLDLSKDVQSINSKKKPSDPRYVRIKEAMAEGYLRLFDFDRWGKEKDDIKKYYMTQAGKKSSLPQFLIQLSKDCKIYGLHAKAEEYAVQACRAVATPLRSCIRANDFKQGQKLIQDCLALLDSVHGNHQTAQGAQLYSCYSQLSQSSRDVQAARLYQQEAIKISLNVCGQKSPQHVNQLVRMSKLLVNEGQYKAAQKLLKNALKQIQTNFQQSSKVQSSKADVLTQLGQVYRVRAFDSKQKQETYRQRAEENMAEALQIKERLFGNASLQISQALQKLGNIYFDQREYHKSKRTYQRCLALQIHHIGKQTPQVANTNTLLGNCSKSLREYQNSKAYYSQAIAILRKVYQTELHLDVALAIGNMGIVLLQQGNSGKGRKLLQTALQILKEVMPDAQNQADYMFFESMLG